jgi:hypothetical protein
MPHTPSKLLDLLSPPCCLLLTAFWLAPGATVRAKEDQAATKSKGKVVARYLPAGEKELPSILLRRRPGTDKWQRLGGKVKKVLAGDTLVSLPGSRSQVEGSRGVRLVLWGDLPEMNFISPLLESAVTLHANGDRDLDLTLREGRIVLTNTKVKTARVRVRFADPAAKEGTSSWNITLPKKGSSVALQVWGRSLDTIAFDKNKRTRRGPQRLLFLYLLKGRANLEIEDETYALEEPPGPSLVIWNSSRGAASGPKGLKKLPDWATHRFPPFPKELTKQIRKSLTQLRDHMVKALVELDTRMKGKRVQAALGEAVRAKDRYLRILGARCYGAIDDLSGLEGALVDRRHAGVRQAAVEVLRHWIGRHKDNDLKLHDFLIKQKKYRPREAKVILNLLRPFSNRDIGRPETYALLIDYLKQDRPAIRELAHWHLIRLVPKGSAIKYDAMGDSKQLDEAYAKWKKLVPDGTVPKLDDEPKKEK